MLSELNSQKRKDLVEAKQDTSDIQKYSKMMGILSGHKEKQTIQDKFQLYEVVDKKLNGIHLIKVNDASKTDMERVGFDQQMRMTHGFIEKRLSEIT